MARREHIPTSPQALCLDTNPDRVQARKPRHLGLGYDAASEDWTGRAVFAMVQTIAPRPLRNDRRSLRRLDCETTAALYGAWKSWAEASGEFLGLKKLFSENLASRGFQVYRDRMARGFRGLRLREGSGRTEEKEL